MKRGLLITLCVALSAAHAGCGPIHFMTGTEAPYITAVDRPSYGKIGLVASQAAPEIDFRFARSEPAVGSSAVAGAIVGSSVWLLIILSSCILAPPSCGPAFAPFLVGGTAAGVAVETTVSKLQPPSAVTPEQAHTAASATLQRLNMQQAIQSRAEQYGRSMGIPFLNVFHGGRVAIDEFPNYAPLRQNGIDHVLEITVLKVGMHLTYSYTSILSISAVARLVRTSDGKVLDEEKYRFVSQPLTNAQWAVNDAEGFIRVLNRAYQEIAEHLVDRLLVYDPPGPRQWAGGAYGCMRGPLLAEYPSGRLPYCAPCFRYSGLSSGLMANFPKVDSLKPLLRWESFPTPRDLEADDKRQLHGVTDVSYEVKLYEAVSVPMMFAQSISYSGNLVYRSNSDSVSHKVDMPLKACTNYFWTFRARFLLNGRPSVTQWAGAHHARFLECAIPDTPAAPHSYYLFRTPCTTENNG